ncbi:hypothetical protein [Cryptosporangium sp. NPDC048952]|uniref:hypothetical protein n=1 Tax=Cryptosporangium sp. NPDC048952 TaxID=3363961 RepID=UPI00371EEA27
MARTPHRPAELVGRIFRGSDALQQGLLTGSQLRGPAWRRLFRNVYVDADLPPTHALRCEAAGLILPAEAAITSYSAACLAGLPIGEPRDEVVVVVPPPSRLRVRGLQVRHAPLHPEEVVRGALPTTTPLRTAWELARERDLLDAVAGLDLMLSYDHVTAAELAARAAERPHSRAATAIRLADARAGSPPESRLRVKLVQAGFPAPVPQFEIRARDGDVRVDLGWPALRVGANYYRDSEHFYGDVYRRNALGFARWTVFSAGVEDLDDPECFARFCDYLRGAMRRSRDEAL